MSLDITIISPEPILKKSTGIYGRINGSTRELTPEECVSHFPDAFAHIDDVPVDTYVSNEVWSGNITHNLTEMAEDCLSFEEEYQHYTLYGLLWRETQQPFTGDYLNVYIAHLAYCLYVLKNNPKRFKKFNPENGWGTYEQLVNFVEDFIKALITMPEGSHIEYSL